MLNVRIGMKLLSTFDIKPDESLVKEVVKVTGLAHAKHVGRFTIG